MNTGSATKVLPIEEEKLLRASLEDLSSRAGHWVLSVVGLPVLLAYPLAFPPSAPTTTSPMIRIEGRAGTQAVASVHRAQPRVRTRLGQKLQSIRAKILASGQELLDWDRVEAELMERRGERWEG